MAWTFFLQYFEFQYFGGFQKNQYFWGDESFMDIFRGNHKGVISMHFRVVSKGQGTELGIFFGLVVKFQFFGGWGLDTPDNFGG